MPLSLEDRQSLDAATKKLMVALAPAELIPYLISAGGLMADDNDIIMNKQQQWGNNYGMIELFAFYKRRATGLGELKSVLEDLGHNVTDFFPQSDSQGAQEMHAQSAKVNCNVEQSNALNDVINQANSVLEMVDSLETKCNAIQKEMSMTGSKDQLSFEKPELVDSKCVCFKCIIPETDKVPSAVAGEPKLMEHTISQFATVIAQLKSSTNTLVGTNLKNLKDSMADKRVDQEIVNRDVQELIDKLAEERKELIKVLGAESSKKEEADASMEQKDTELENEIEWVKGRVETLENKLEKEFKSAEEQDKVPTPVPPFRDFEHATPKAEEDVLIKQVEEQMKWITELEKENKQEHTKLFKTQEEMAKKLTETKLSDASQREEQAEKIAELERKVQKNVEDHCEQKYDQEMLQKQKELDDLKLNVGTLNETVREMAQNYKAMKNSHDYFEAKLQGKPKITWLLGGQNSNSKAITIIEIYNPSGPTIRSLTHLRLKTPRNSHNCVLVHGNLYIIGGQDNSNFFDSVEVFAPYSNIAIDSSLVLKEKRSRAATTTKDGHIFVFGGWNGSPLSSSEFLNVSHDVFEHLAPMPSTRYYHTAECIGDCMYLIGGWANGSHSNSVLVYDPATNKYNTNNHNLFDSRHYHASAVEESTIVVTGGWDGSKPLSSSERYDPRDGNKSMRLADMKEVRWGHALVNIGGQLVAIGGAQIVSGPLLDSIEVYDSRMGKWTESETKLLQPRAHFGAVVV